MIDGQEFINIVKKYFSFLISEFNFKIIEEKIRGNAFYDVQFKDSLRIISISYENIENYLLTTVFILENGQLPDYDDKTKTLHLNKLNAIAQSMVDRMDIELNAEKFSQIQANNDLERKLLKSAKDLRLVLLNFNFVIADNQ